MKNIITILILLVAVGCLTPEQKALRDCVVGRYERQEGEDTYMLHFLRNGTVRELSYEKGELK